MLILLACGLSMITFFFFLLTRSASSSSDEITKKKKKHSQSYSSSDEEERKKKKKKKLKSHKKKSKKNKRDHGKNHKKKQKKRKHESSSSSSSSSSSESSDSDWHSWMMQCLEEQHIYSAVHLKCVLQTLSSCPIQVITSLRISMFQWFKKKKQIIEFNAIMTVKKKNLVLVLWRVLENMHKAWEHVLIYCFSLFILCRGVLCDTWCSLLSYVLLDRSGTKTWIFFSKICSLLMFPVLSFCFCFHFLYTLCCSMLLIKVAPQKFDNAKHEC